MAPSSLDVVLKGSSGRNTRGLLRVIILCTIAAAAVSSRLFSVISMCQLTSFMINMLTIS
jgi:dolichyl-diphosphooligosaccharide--protein glycosyltransferase